MADHIQEGDHLANLQLHADYSGIDPATNTVKQPGLSWVVGLWWPKTERKAEQQARRVKGLGGLHGVSKK